MHRNGYVDSIVKGSKEIHDPIIAESVPYQLRIFSFHSFAPWCLASIQMFSDQSWLFCVKWTDSHFIDR